MGITDKISDMTDKVTDKLGGSDKAKEKVDQGAQMAKDKTGGKFDDHVDKGGDMAKDMIDKSDKPDDM
ncbi:MAG: antitoxin [Catenulispora sp.]|nr:antitoxin [Catenulispora sp.]